jgi:copper chaperone CopZ
MTSKGEQMTEKIFQVPNISCQHCVNTIKNELFELEGVERVEPDAETREVKVEFHDPATELAIIALLEEINYPVER